MSARDKLRALRETNAELLHACKLAVAWIDADRDARYIKGEITYGQLHEDGKRGSP